jgi:hypothetical protein
MTPRLLRTHALTITRYTDSEAVYDPVTGRYDNSGISSTTFDIKCSIQPFRLGDRELKLPDGITAEDARFVYTDPSNPIRTSSQYDKVIADTTVIEGIEYEAFDSSNWTGFGLRTDNYKVVFIRKDLTTGL